MVPVSVSISVIMMGAPNGNVKLGGSQKLVATRPGVSPGGKLMARYEAAAISAKVTDFPLVLSVQTPLANDTLSLFNSMAAYFLIFFFRSWMAKYMAVPPMAVPRLPN